MDGVRLLSNNFNFRRTPAGNRPGISGPLTTVESNSEPSQQRPRKKSRSPSRRMRPADPFAAAPGGMKTIKRKKSSSSLNNNTNNVNTSSAVTASSGDELMTMDHGHRLRAAINNAATVRTNSLDARLNKKARHKGKEHRRHRSEEAGPESSSAAAAPRMTSVVAEAELQRLRRENEQLKQELREAKKSIKKHNKTIEELKGQLGSAKLTKKDNEAQIQTLTVKNKANEELINTIETALQCQICMELLAKPYALSPCGHILCVSCLQEWFRKAPPSADDMDIDPEDLQHDPGYIMHREKSCPCCRAIVVRRPVPIFIVKSIAASLVKIKAAGAGTPPDRDSPPPTDEDPWKGLFPDHEEDYSQDEDNEDDEDEDGYDDEDDVSGDEMEGIPWFAEHAFGLLPMRLPLGHPRFLEEVEESSGSEGYGEDAVDAEEDEVEVEDDGDSEDDFSVFDEEASYVRPQWEPPAFFSEEEVTPAHASLIRRGCTSPMIATYGMEYSHSTGIVAYVSSFQDGWEGVGRESKKRMNRIFLGWNIHLARWDDDGDAFVSQAVNDMVANPGRWEIVPRPRESGMRAGLSDARKLVKSEEVADYHTTDTEAWFFSD